MAAAALVAVMTLFGLLTRPDPESVADATTTTSTTTAPFNRPVDLENFSVDQIARGAPLEWEMVDIANAGFVRDIVAIGERVHVFFAHWEWFYEPSELRHVRIDGPAVTEMKSPGRVGQWSSLRSNQAGQITGAVWSNDGLEMATWEDGQWSLSPVAVELPDQRSLLPNLAITTGDISLIAGSPFFDVNEIVQPLVEEHLGAPVDARRLSVEPRGTDDVLVNVYGPIGIRLFSSRGTEIGMTKEQIQAAVGAFQGQTDHLLFASHDNATWQPIDIPGLRWFVDVGSLSDGTFVISGGGDSGTRTWTSTDGINWKAPQSYVPSPDIVRVFGDRLIGVDWAGPRTLSMSSDGHTWEQLGVSELLPTRPQIRTSGFGTGPGGVAITANPVTAIGRPPRPAPASLVSDGVNLQFDLWDGVVTMSDGSITRTWQIHAFDAPEWVVVEPLGDVVKILNPDTDELLTEISFADLYQIEAAFTQSFGNDPSQGMVLFSPEGKTWAIQPTPWASVDARFVTVTTSHIYVVANRGPWIPGERRSEIWRAEIP